MKSGIAFSGYWYGPKLFVHRVTTTGRLVGVVVGERDQVGAGLRRRVRRARLERIGLLRGTDLDRAVDLVGADVHDAAHLEPARGVHDDVRAEAVGVDEVVGAGDRTVDVALGGEVDDGVVAGHRLFERARIADVALDERVARVVVDVAQRREVARVGERVVDGDFVVGVGEHVADVVGPDEAGAAGDEDLHSGCLTPGRLGSGPRASAASRAVCRRTGRPRPRGRAASP